jgi:Histidine kinase-, DNA gyrase B-, and HSP90-like ATPase
MTIRKQLYDTTPLTNVLFGLSSQKWNVPGATSELIDNSFGELRGNAKHVWITYNAQNRMFSVLDNGVGMDHVGALFQLGKTIGRGVRDIGKYGQGGTMAILWLPTAVSIWTMRDGKVMLDDVRWDDYKNKTEFPQVNDTWERASLRNTPPELFELGHGTLIRMHLRDGRSFQPDAVQRELSRLYAPGLRKDYKITWTTIARDGRTYEQQLAPEQFELPSDPSKIVNFNFVMKARDDEGNNVTLPVTGQVALIDDLPYARSTVSLGYGPRVIIETRDCYSSADGSAKYSGTGVWGWLDLGEGWQDFLTTTKDGIKADHVRAVLMNHVFKRIEPLLKQTEKDRLSLVLDGLRLELTDVFNGLNELDFVLEESETETTLGHDPTVRYPGFNDPKPFKPFVPNLKADDEMPKLVPGEDKKEKAVVRLEFIEQNDTAMKGALCRLQILSEAENNLKIEVNIEHPVMQELLYGTNPIQKLALILLVTREIAASLADNEAVLRRFVVPRLMRKLDQLGTDNGHKERLLARLLMDSARRPRVAA